MRSPVVANLTVVIEDEVLLRARKRALDQGTSVNAVVRGYLESYAGGRDRAAAMRVFLDRAAASTARSRRPWSRDDLHDR